MEFQESLLEGFNLKRISNLIKLTIMLQIFLNLFYVPSRKLIY